MIMKNCIVILIFNHLQIQAMIPATPDIWKIRPEAKLKYDEKFYQLKPINGYITGIFQIFFQRRKAFAAQFLKQILKFNFIIAGDQAKNLFLMSGLPPQILAHIW